MNEELILAIESNCDETSVAVVRNGTEILSNITALQINSHKRFGDVVPEVASRHHAEQITLCLEDALVEAGASTEDLSAVAVTYGPGLVGLLLIGISAAKAFAWTHQLPPIPANRMAGHTYAARLVEPFQFPLVALLVSGGRTELVYMQKDGPYEIIGETRDDATGRTYDKVGRVLGLSYPSGKEIDQLAHQGKDNYHFPRAVIHEDNYDFSFSGSKNAFVNLAHSAQRRGEDLDRNDLAASFQASVINILTTKTLRARQNYPVKRLIIAGGIAVNQELREGLQDALAAKLPEVKLMIPSPQLCGDNATMIGTAAHVEMQKRNSASHQLNADPSLVLSG